MSKAHGFLKLSTFVNNWPHAFCTTPIEDILDIVCRHTSHVLLSMTKKKCGQSASSFPLPVHNWQRFLSPRRNSATLSSPALMDLLPHLACSGDITSLTCVSPIKPLTPVGLTVTLIRSTLPKTRVSTYPLSVFFCSHILCMDRVTGDIQAPGIICHHIEWNHIVIFKTLLSTKLIFPLKDNR